MKKYKLVDKTPMQAGAFGAMGGASAGATTVPGALIGAAVGFAAGTVMGGYVARKDRKAHNALNESQFGKK